MHFISTQIFFSPPERGFSIKSMTSVQAFCRIALELNRIYICSIVKKVTRNTY